MKIQTIFSLRNRCKRVIGNLLLSCFLAGTSSTLSAEPVVEVMHWWHRGGEARAMQVLRDEFELRGGTWFDVAGEESIKVLNTAVSRMAKGYPPSLVQWNSGWEVSQISNLGLLNSVDVRSIKSPDSAFIDSVVDMVTVDGRMVAVPVNVHSENWFWYKQENIPDDTENPLLTWELFLDFAETFSQSGRAVLAVGNDNWQHRNLFNNVLLGIAGQNLFERIYSDLDTTALESVKFENTLKTFREIRKYSRSFGDGRWEQQIAAVASNKAFTVSMGDWAKGEFRKLGLKLGRNYECIPAPDTEDNLILAIDVFAFGQVTSADEKEGQKLFLEIVADKAVSETFNYLKGSLSPLHNTDVTSLDKCNKIAYRNLNIPGKAIKPYASNGDRGFLARIDHHISNLWVQDTDVDIDIWIGQLRSLLQEEQSKRNINHPIAQQ